MTAIPDGEVLGRIIPGVVYDPWSRELDLEIGKGKPTRI